MFDIMGFGEFVRQTDAKVLDSDRDPAGFPRRLIEVEMPGDDENLVLLEVTDTTPQPDGTHKLYHLGVDPEMRTIKAARASLVDFSVEEFDEIGGPDVET